MTKEIRRLEARSGVCGGATVLSAFDQGSSGLRRRGDCDGLIRRETASSPVLAGTRGESCLPPVAARAFAPLLYADWMRAVFIHFEVEPELLQGQVPFALDLWQGKAIVSLVAFTMERLRPRIGGLLGELAFKPIATTHFLNIRTYVRHRAEPGIYFMAEFLSNRLFVRLGRPTFGLPYRFGDLVYGRDCGDGAVEGTVTAAGGGRRLTYQARLDSAAEPQESRPGTLDFFLLERYAGFTCDGVKRRRFRIWHPAWRQVRIEPLVQDEGLLATTGGWIGHARLVKGNYSAGVRGVWMGWPVRIHPVEPRRRLTVFFEG